VTRYPKVDGERCQKCHGFGIVRQMFTGAGGQTSRMKTCDRCGGLKIEPKKRGKK
jgi:DnaJ-class molecular chaperone